MQTSYSSSLHLFKLALAQAKSPRFLVIRGTVRDPIRCFGKSEQVRPQFSQRHCSAHRDAIIQHMKVSSF